MYMYVCGYCLNDFDGLIYIKQQTIIHCRVHDEKQTNKPFCSALRWKYYCSSLNCV